MFAPDLYDSIDATRELAMEAESRAEWEAMKLSPYYDAESDTYDYIHEMEDLDYAEEQAELAALADAQEWDD